MTSKKIIHILLVDKLTDTAASHSAALHKPGFNIMTAAPGHEALSIIEENHFALIIINLASSVTDGIWMIEQLKKTRKTMHIPLILITDDAAKNSCKHLGCDSGPVDYMITPIDPDLLKHKVDLFLTLKQAQDNLKKIKTNLKLEIKRRKYIENEIMYREKLEGVIETAVTVCHELTQPLQIIAGYSDLILMNTDDPRNLHQRIHKIKEQISRVTALTQQLMGITRYKTKAYLGKTTPVDMDLVNERRKHKRYIPKSGTFLIPHFNERLQGQVIDISRDGLAFWSDEPEITSPPDITRVSLSIPEEDIILKNLPCRFLSNHAGAHVMVLNHSKMRRHSIRFEPLTDMMLNQLEQFILNHTSAQTE